KNSATTIAGQEMRRERALLSTVRISPRTSATTKPASDASMVTIRPRSRMGRIEIAKASSPCWVSQLMPKSISGPHALPAADGALEQPHDGGQHQRHAEIHEEDDGIDGRRILRVGADLLGPERQVAQADEGSERGILEVLHGEVAEGRHHFRDRLREHDAPERLP